MWRDIKCSVQNWGSPLKTESTEVFSPFEVKTLSLSTTFKVHDNAPVCCTSSPLYVIVAVANQVSIYKEDSFEVVWQIPADSPSSISLSDDSCLLIVTQNSGLLQLYYVPTKISLWSHVFEKDSLPLRIKDTYLSINNSGFLKIYAFSKENIIFEVSNISISTLYKAIEDGHFNETFDGIHIEELDVFTLYPKCTLANIFQIFRNTLAIGLVVQHSGNISSNTEFFTIEDMIDGDVEADWEWNSHEKSILKCYDFSSHESIIKAVNTRDGSYIVFLNEKHVLSVMCSCTLSILKTWVHSDSGSCIKSFVMNETVDPSSFLVVESKIGLVVETSVGTSGPIGHVFEIRKFSSFQLIYSVHLSHFVQLIECKPNQDFWYIIDGEHAENSGKLGSSHLNLKAVFETLPEARLINLVNRRKFLEAEKLAESSNLSSEVIHKTKINCILNNLAVNKYQNVSKSTLDQIWSELDDSFKHIKNIEFIKTCILLSLPEKIHMERFLLCLKTWVIHNSSGNNIRDIISKVNQNLNRLITHEILYNEVKSCVTLKDFLSKDLLNYMISELKAGNLDTSFVIWKRHKVELLDSLSSETVNQILSSIPDCMPSHHLILFLCDEFLPALFSRNPDSIDAVADWLAHRVYLVELYEKDGWPENGLKLVTSFLKVIRDLQEKDKTGEISFTTSLLFAKIHKKFIHCELPVGCLSEFSRDLTWLVELKTKFNCKLSLADCQESKMDALFAVLDRVDLQFISNAIDEFVRPYALENEFDFEYCLEHYIKHTLQTSCFTWWSWDEDPWEERFIAVTEAIHCTEKWANAALLVASRAAVPWSQQMQDLVQKGMKCEHPRKKDFQIEYKLVGLKEVLLKYEMKSFPINNDVKLIDVLVNYILKQNKDSAFEDAKKVLMSVHDHAVDFDVHFKCLQYAVNHKKLDDISGILSCLSQETAVKCAKRLLQYFKLQLDDNFLIKYQKDHIKSMLLAGLYLIEYLQIAKNPIKEDLITPFRSLLKLQEEFSLYLTFSEITSKSHCQMLIDSAIGEFLKNKVLRKTADTSLRKHKPTSSGISELHRLGDILLFEREEIMGFLITICLQKNKYDLVLKLCKELTVSYPSQNTAETLMQVVRHFYLNFRTITYMNFSVMVDTICHLNSVTITYCKEDFISKCLDVVQLSSYISTLKEISGQHSLSISPELTSNAYHKWKFYPNYQDEGFQLDCDIITNYIVEISRNIVRESDLTSLVSYHNTDLLNLSGEVINHMKERGQGMAALRTLLFYFSMQNNTLQTSTDVTQNSAMVLPIVEELAYSVIQIALSQRKVDFSFVLNLFTILEEDSQLISLKALLKKYSSDFNRLSVIGQVGMELANSLQNNDVFTKCENIYKKASLLSKQNVKSAPSLNVIMNSTNPKATWAIVNDLILSQNVSLPIIYECCSAFQLKTDHVLIAYLNNILAESEKKFLPFEDFEMKIVPSLKKAEIVIGYITDEELLYNNFLHLLKKISPYSYEVLLFIKEQLQLISANIQTIDSGAAEKDIKLLKFLKVYKRISPLDEMELNVWKSLQPSDSQLPSISNKRLPFHWLLQDNLHKIINPELTSNTLPVWLKIAPVLRIPVDHLVIMAVKNSVVSYLAQQASPHVMLNPDTQFISVIDDLMAKISEPEAAACCANWVTNKMPPGGNKVSFATIAVKFAQRWYEEGAGNGQAIEFYNKFISISYQSAVEKVLYKNNLTSDAVLSLMHSPTKLIEYLIETFSLNITQCMKVCAAASEIGNITKVDTTRIFLDFILKWCDITRNTAVNMDETFSEDTNLSNEIGDIDGENILRIIYLLLSLPKSDFPNLYNVLKVNFKDLPAVPKARLLFCFVSIFDTEVISEALEIELQLLKEYLIPLVCGVELESLNLMYSVPMFAKCNKTELIQRILSSNFNNSRAVIFCIRLCLEFNIWDIPIWEVILRRMVLKPMDYALQDILMSSQGHLKHLWHNETFIAAWNCVMRNILQIKPTCVSVLLSKLYKAIMSCPCTPSLDILFLTSELKMVLQTYDERNFPELDTISDLSSFILSLKNMIDEFSQKAVN